MMKTILSSFLIGALLMIPVLSACSAPVAIPTSPTQAAASSTTALPATPLSGAFQSGQYHNLFKELANKSGAEIQAKIDAAWQQLFYGDDASQRVYYPVGDDMAYVKDIGNDDVRTEGVSYGMMIAVQLNKQAEFNRLWTWAKKYMYQTDGQYKGYFAWHCKSDGTQLDANPASDGEEWFVMALLFAANRWGNGTGIYNYQAEAQAILTTMLHKGEDTQSIATNIFDAKAKQVVFVPRGNLAAFTDPSYHLPAYYELWARWANQDNAFWTEAAQASRVFFKKAANPATGLMPDYAEFDGQASGDDHADFRFDAFRVASNVAVDYAWFAADPWEVEQSNRQLEFFYKQGINSYGNQFTLAGKPLSGDHSTGLVAMNAVAALAATTDHRKDFVTALWNADIPSGKWRYYDGLLYLLGLLHVSGNFKIYHPGAASASP